MVNYTECVFLKDNHFLWCITYQASLVAQMVKNMPLFQETWVQSLGQEAPLEKEMATHSSILAWRIPWTEEPGGLHVVHGVPKSHTQLNNQHFHFKYFKMLII